MGSILVDLSNCCKKIPDKSNLRKVYCGLQFQEIVVLAGKAWLQEQEEADHMTTGSTKLVFSMLSGFVSSFSTLVLQVCTRAFTTHLGPNIGPHACVPGTLPSEPSPQTIVCSFLVD